MSSRVIQACRLSLIMLLCLWGLLASGMDARAASEAEPAAVPTPAQTQPQEQPQTQPPPQSQAQPQTQPQASPQPAATAPEKAPGEASSEPSATAAQGASPANAVAAVTVDPVALEGLIKTLEDPAQRDAFLGRLKTLLAVKQDKPAEPPEGLASSFFSSLAGTLDGVSGKVYAAVDTLQDAPKVWYWVEKQLSSEADRVWWGKILGKFVVILAVGTGADFLVRWLLKKPRRILEGKIPRHYWARIPVVLLYGLVCAIPIVAFAAAAYAVLPWLSLIGVAQKSAIIIIGANILARLVMLVAQMLLMPNVASLRLFQIKTETAHYLMRWLNRFVIVMIYCYFGNEVARWLGLPWDAYQFIQRLLGLVASVMLIMLCLQKRREVAAWIHRRSELRKSRRLKVFENKLANVWHIPAVLYVVSTYIVWAFQIAGGFEYIVWGSVWTVIIVSLAFLTLEGGRRFEKWLLASSESWEEGYSYVRNRLMRYMPLFHLIGRMLLYIAVLFVLLEIWGAGTLQWLGSNNGRRALMAFSSILMVAVIAVIVWEMVCVSIERYLTQTDKQGMQIQRSSRVRTLLALARNAVMVVLIIVVGMIVLSELGVNIAPLLAGAGVIGLAIGFGSQALVKDLITGIFILLEDAISVGDVVSLGTHSGTVEALSIRAIRLRDAQGAVHTIPFGVVDRVTNMGRDYAYAIFDIGVSYREDTDAVSVVMQEVGDELQNDPEFAFQILEPIEIQGVTTFGASAVIIRARIKTLPLKQWSVSRAYNRLLKKRFDEEGIEMPYPHTTVYFGEDKKGNAPPVHLKLERGDVKALEIVQEKEKMEEGTLQKE